LLNLLAFSAFVAVCGGAASEATCRLLGKRWIAYLAAALTVPIIVAVIVTCGLAFARELELSRYQITYVVTLQSLIIMHFALLCAFFGIRIAQAKTP
jgi:hypothetical protein